jgi:aminoglycoside phosphotransferase (APT) family kinase protein
VTDDIAAPLHSWLAGELGDDGLRIEGLHRTSAGFSRENWVFDATWTESGHSRRGAFIARRDPLGSVLETDRRVEGAVLRALESTAIPAPTVRWLDATGEHLGRPAVVMDLETGTCDGWVLNGSRPLDVRVALAHELYDLLADIHLIDWRALGLDRVLEDPGEHAALAAVDHWEGELRRIQLEAEPELEIALVWLRDHAPTSPVTTLVHGDFKPGNVLLQGDRVSCVLDWETVHLGDPLEDVGWVTNPLRQGEHRIPEHWEPSDLVARWSARTGLAADPDAIRWWNVLANVKLSIIVLTGTHAFVDGRLDRIYQQPVMIYRLILDAIGA